MNNCFKKFTAFLLVLCMFTGFNIIPVKADNEASLQLKNILAGSSNTGLIRQECISYDAPRHEISWKVTVEQDKSGINNNGLRVAILLIYDTAKSSGWTVENNNNSNLTDFKGEILSIAAGQQQRYVESSFAAASGSSLKLTVHPVTDKGKQVADLLVITKDDSTGIDASKAEQAFTYKTCIVDPNIYMSNVYGTTIGNGASLFNGDNKIDDGTANTKIYSYMLKTDTISVQDALEDLTNPQNINGESSFTDSFNYEDKTAVFRLHINATGIVDVTGGPTKDKTKQLGKAIITDKLPDGWEFVEVTESKKFLIYEGSGNKGKVTAKTWISDPNFVTADFTENGKASFIFNNLDKPYVVLVKARATDETLKQYYDENTLKTLANSVEITEENKKYYNESNSHTFQIKSQVLSVRRGKKFLKHAAYPFWEVNFNPYILNYSNVKVEVVFPEGLDLPMDSKGNIKADGQHIDIHKNIIDKESGGINLGDKVEATDKWTAYDPVTRTLSFIIPDPKQGYTLGCPVETTTDAGSALTITYRLMEGQNIKHTFTSDYTITEDDIKETKKHSGYIEITKKDENGNALSDVEFTVFTEEGVTYRKGVTDQNGMRTLLALPEGNYILKETKAPQGYDLSKEEHKIRVLKDGSTFQTFIDGKTGSQANQTTLQNFRTGTKYGSVSVRKILDGNAAEKGKLFNFSIRIPGIQGDYAYTKNSAGENGVLTFTDGKAEFWLKGGEDIKIRNLPADREYTVTESNYTKDGYTTVKSGDTGKITAEKVQYAVFVNTKNSKNEEGGNEGGGGGAGSSSPATPSSSSVTLKAQLTLDNKAPAKSDYLFVLKNSNGDIMQTKTNVKGEILFDDLKFSSAGTYLYTISEIPNGQSNIQYDPVIYTVKINVLNGDDFKYSAEVSYLKDGAAYTGELLFENKSIIKISPKEILEIIRVNYLSSSLQDPMARMRMKQRRFLITQHRVIKNKLIRYNK